MDLNRRRCVAISSRIVQRLLYQSHRTPCNQTALTKHSRTVSSISISFHPIHRIGHTQSTYPVSQGLNSGIQKRNNIEHGNDDAEGCQRLVRHCSCLVFDPIYDKSLSLESKKRRCVLCDKSRLSLPLLLLVGRLMQLLRTNYVALLAVWLTARVCAQRERLFLCMTHSTQLTDLGNDSHQRIKHLQRMTSQLVQSYLRGSVLQSIGLFWIHNLFILD